MDRHEFLTARLEVWRQKVAFDLNSISAYHELMKYTDALKLVIEMDKTWPVLVQNHEEMSFEPVVETDINRVAMRFIQQGVWMTQQQYFERFGKEAPSHPIVRKLLEMHQHHPDFKKEWLA